jgi:hypothetical protein
MTKVKAANMSNKHQGRKQRRQRACCCAVCTQVEEDADKLQLENDQKCANGLVNARFAFLAAYIRHIPHGRKMCDEGNVRVKHH